MSKENTAMQKHISDLEQALLVVKGLRLESAESAIESCIDNAKHHLPQERKQIEDAWQNGFDTNNAISPIGGWNGDGSDYFANKYLSNE